MKNLRFLWFFLWLIYFNICYTCFFVLFQYGPGGFVQGLKDLPTELPKLMGRDTGAAK